MTSFWLLVRRFAEALFFGLIAGCVLLLLAPVVLGWRPYTVLTGSMRPGVQPGDVVMARPVLASTVRVLGELTPVGGAADLTRVNDRLHRGRGVVGDDGVRRAGRAPQDREVARPEQHGLLAGRQQPGVTADHGGHRERGVVAQADRPGRVEQAAQQVEVAAEVGVR